MVLSELYAQFRDAGNRNTGDFFRQINDKAPILIEKYQPYILQFVKDVRDGLINYRDYVDSKSQEPDKTESIAAQGNSPEGSESILEMVWTPAIEGLSLIEEDLMTVGTGMGEMTL